MGEVSCFLNIFKILNIFLGIKTIRQFKLIIPHWSYYFEFMVFVLLSYIFPGVMSRQISKVNVLILTF